jgi:hypothetical protein
MAAATMPSAGQSESAALVAAAASSAWVPSIAVILSASKARQGNPPPFCLPLD